MGNKKKNRNYYIDNIRGLATISVVFIHTVFWSGSSYVPEYMRNLSLLIDVPIFFLLTGMLMSVVKNINPIKQVTKLIFSFFILVLAYQILFMDINVNNLFSALFFYNAVLDKFPVVSGSYWFVPVYVIALLVSYMLIKQYSSKKLFTVIILIFFYYLFTYFTKIEINFYNFNYSILFFISCILIGYLGAMKKYRYLYIVLSLVSILIYLSIYLSKKIVLQDYKFPVGIPYVVASMISLFLILHFFHKSTFLNLKIPILSFVGCNSLYFYMSQGIGASILFYILPFLKFSWQLKMIFAFIINIIASLIIGYLFIWVEKQFNKIIRRGNLNVES